jgi:lipopolysaccharide export system permease protein
LKILDRLILKEIFGPWVFGVGMFTSLLMAGLFLGRLTEWIASGVSPVMVGQIFILYMPGVMAKTFPMAVLLAALLSFGRLSADSEITALRAAGASLPRIVWPVTLFSVAIAGVSFLFADFVVPGASRQSLKLANEIARGKDVTSTKPVFQSIIRNQKLKLGVIAKRANVGDRSLEGVTLVSYDDNGKEEAILLAKTMRYISENNWRVEGGGTILLPNGNNVIHFTEAWPDSIPTIGTDFEDLIRIRDDEFDAKSMAEIRRSIETFQREGSRTPATIANYEYGYWNKLSIPCAAIIFGTLGAVLGIRNHRTGTATGFALTVGIIFGYQLLSNFMAIWASGGVIPAWAASFGPLFIGAVATTVILQIRNVT